MMESVKQFTVGDVTYSVARASAIDQDAILSLLTSPITERWAVLRQRGDVSDVESMIMPMFMAMPQSIKQPVSGMLMKKRSLQVNNRRLISKRFPVVWWSTTRFWLKS